VPCSSHEQHLSAAAGAANRADGDRQPGQRCEPPAPAARKTAPGMTPHTADYAARTPMNSTKARQATERAPLIVIASVISSGPPEPPAAAKQHSV